MRRAMLVAALILLAPASGARAGEKDAPLRAVAGEFPPFVMQVNGQLTGFSIDLWTAVAGKLGTSTSFELVPDTASAFEALRSGRADAVVTGHFYTLERDREFDFSYPILNAGQQVMVPDAGQGSGLDTPLRTYLRLLFSRSALLWFATALALVVVPAHVIWIFFRKGDDIVPRDERYLPGIASSMAWATEALLGQVTVMPRRKLARGLAIAWLFAGVLFIALFVAQLTATLTVARFRGIINGPDDLVGKRVATQAGSTSVDVLSRLGARIEAFATPEEAFASLLAGQVDAVVLAAPGLQHFEEHGGAGRVRVVGPEFRKRDLSFMFPIDAPLRRRVNSALVALHEDGTYERLREKWFGRE